MACAHVTRYSVRDRARTEERLQPHVPSLQPCVPGGLPASMEGQTQRRVEVRRRRRHSPAARTISPQLEPSPRSSNRLPAARTISPQLEPSPRSSNTLHLTPYTLHLTPYTSHLTPHTLHLTPYTVHRTPHTLHLTPYTLQASSCSSRRLTACGRCTSPCCRPRTASSPASATPRSLTSPSSSSSRASSSEPWTGLDWSPPRAFPSCLQAISKRALQVEWSRRPRPSAVCGASGVCNLQSAVLFLMRLVSGVYLVSVWCLLSLLRL